eukprot:968893_1
MKLTTKRTISITVNGKQFLRIYAEPNEAHKFFDYLKQQTSDTFDEEYVMTSSTYEKGLGCAFHDLERIVAGLAPETNTSADVLNSVSIAQEAHDDVDEADGAAAEAELETLDYEEGLGKRFQDLQWRIKMRNLMNKNNKANTSSSKEKFGSTGKNIMPSPLMSSLSYDDNEEEDSVKQFSVGKRQYAVTVSKSEEVTDDEQHVIVLHTVLSKYSY